MSSPIRALTRFGQSLWYDNIQRRLLENGELASMIARGDIRGITSNPTIFRNAIAETNDYDSALLPLAWSGWDRERIFWQLAVEDVRAACDLFKTLYQQSEAADGYVSLEVSPALAHDTEGTLAQAIQLWETVSRPNLMIKIPATPEGLPAVRRAIAQGINVNVTLVFSLERYRQVMEAYLAGLDDYLDLHPPSSWKEGATRLPVSVASFFVSRIDTKVDSLLPPDSPLRGKAAIAYAKLAYAEFQQVFRSKRFARYQAAGFCVQRPLWASTSTKNPAYPDTLYVDNLIGPSTVNTVPPQTLEAFRHHGKASPTLTAHLDAARQTIASLQAQGISMEKVTAELEAEGVEAFLNSYLSLLQTIEERRNAAVGALGPLADPVAQRVSQVVADKAPARLWSHDPTLWTDSPKGQEEIRNRLGWLDLPVSSRSALKEIEDFVADVRKSGLTHALLLGMGGSSLAPEVFSLVFGEDAAFSSTFSILDSTDPGQVIETARRFPPHKTLYLVSSKSGGTAEVNALFHYFWDQSGKNGSHFAAITDPDTSLETLARERGFRKVFRADPTVGGRFSAFSHFGLVPAALMGIDLERLLSSAAWMMRQCAEDVTGERNPGLVLGVVLGEAALSGRDKLTLIADPPFVAFGSWLEQLIAESSGKDGKGIVVVDDEPAVAANQYGNDRLFVYFRSAGEKGGLIAALRQAGHPVLEFSVPDPYALMAEFYRWEVATAVACAILGVNAFDQPDVQDNKTRTLQRIDAYKQYSKIEEGNPLWTEQSMQAFSNMRLNGQGLRDGLMTFLASGRPGDYIAINAYLPRTPDMTGTLQELRGIIQGKTGCATTLGFGPRFLHSTGQLHKGGPDSGLFLQITADPVEDLDIPGQGMSFGVLQRCQALGDYEALADRGRRILRIHLRSPVAIRELIGALR